MEPKEVTPENLKKLLKPKEKKSDLIDLRKSIEFCSYPGCMQKPEIAHDVDISNEKCAKVRLPFCFYHKLVVAGNHFHLEKIGEFQFEFAGPLKQVEVVEQVIAAIKTTEARVKALKKKKI